MCKQKCIDVEKFKFVVNLIFGRYRSCYKRASSSETRIRQTTKTSFKDGSGCVKEIARSRSRLQVYRLWSKRQIQLRCDATPGSNIIIYVIKELIL